MYRAVLHGSSLCSRYGHRQAGSQAGSQARRGERISPDRRIYASAVVVAPIMNARLRHFNLISDYAQDNPGSEPRIRSVLKIRPPVCSYIAKYSRRAQVSIYCCALLIAKVSRKSGDYHIRQQLPLPGNLTTYLAQFPHPHTHSHTHSHPLAEFTLISIAGLRQICRSIEKLLDQPDQRDYLL